MSKMTWKKASIIVLSERGSLSLQELAKEIIERGLIQTGGKTPWATLNADIGREIHLYGESSRFIRVREGVYGLREGVVQPVIQPPISFPQKEEVTNVKELNFNWIGACGFWWRRDQVDLKKAKPQILGMTGRDYRVVDFYNQIGIYLLFDEQKNIIYVGRTIDSLGARLQYHDKDKRRWTTFSWIGLKPVRSDGSLSEEYPNVPAMRMITLLEGFLIEAIRPHSNQKSGDSIGESEYKQVVVQR